METPEIRFVLTPTALADRQMGLEWEPRPSDAAVAWAEAAAAATARGWRLPSTAELMGFLGDLTVESASLPPAGATFWSATGSPFARASQVRAVSREPGGRFVVILLDRGQRARCWAVRSAVWRPAPPSPQR